jgi:predicted Zn-dependent protease
MGNKIALGLHQALQNKDWKEVEYWAREWLKTNPNSVYLYEKLGEVAEKQGRVVDAILHYETCFRIFRDHHDRSRKEFIKRLDILYQREQLYEESYNLCQWYVENYSYDWDAWNRLKRAARKVGNIELSGRAEAEAKARRGKRVLPSGELPSKYSEDDLSPQALEEYSKELMERIKPTHPELYLILNASPLEEEE